MADVIMEVGEEVVVLVAWGGCLCSRWWWWQRQWRRWLMVSTETNIILGLYIKWWQINNFSIFFSFLCHIVPPVLWNTFFFPSYLVSPVHTPCFSHVPCHVKYETMIFYYVPCWVKHETLSFVLLYHVLFHILNTNRW